MTKEDLEKLVIKHILDNNKYLNGFIKRGVKSNYMDSIPAKLFDCCLQLKESGEPINEYTLAKETGKYETYIAIVNNIANLTTYTFSKFKLVEYLHEIWKKDIILNSFNDIKLKLKDGDNVDSQIEAIEGVKTRLNDVGGVNTHKNIIKGIQSLTEDAKNLYAGVKPNNLIPCPTGFTFDSIESGNLVYLTALTGCGKSTYARQWAFDLAKNGKKGLFFSMEMNEREMIKGFNQYHTGINPRRLNNCDKGTYDTWIDGLKHCQSVLENNIKLICGHKTRAELQSDFFRETYENDIDYVIVDYLGLVSGDRQESEVERIQNNSILFRRLSLNYNVAFIVICQFNRGANDGNKPFLHQLKGSSQLEQDANIVYIISNVEQDVSGQSEIEVNIQIAKCRDGWTGDLKATFHKTKGKFVC
jgi:replicative DNA helicase